MKEEQDATFDSFDKGQERTTYQLGNTLPAGSKAELKIGFSGKLTGSMTGYYRSSWEEDGKTKYYSLTQFEVYLQESSSILQLTLHPISPRPHVVLSLPEGDIRNYLDFTRWYRKSEQHARYLRGASRAWREFICRHCDNHFSTPEREVEDQ